MTSSMTCWAGDKQTALCNVSTFIFVNLLYFQSIFLLINVTIVAYDHIISKKTSYYSAVTAVSKCLCQFRARDIPDCPCASFRFRTWRSSACKRVSHSVAMSRVLLDGIERCVVWTHYELRI